MPASITLNKKPAAATIRDGLFLDLMTTLPSRKDSNYDLLHDHRARVYH